MQADNVGPPEAYVLRRSGLPRWPIRHMGNRLLDTGEQRALPARGNCGAHGGRAHRMLRCGSIEDRRAQPVAVGMAELERGEFLGMRLEQPWMIDQCEQNERLARGKRAAPPADNRARPKPGA